MSGRSIYKVGDGVYKVTFNKSKPGRFPIVHPGSKDMFLLITCVRCSARSEAECTLFPVQVLSPIEKGFTMVCVKVCPYTRFYVFKKIVL